jgi:hypothetical protein
MEDRYDELMFRIQTNYSVEDENLQNDMSASILLFDDNIDDVEEAYKNDEIDFWERESLLSHIEDYIDEINRREKQIFIW